MDWSSREDVREYERKWRLANRDHLNAYRRARRANDGGKMNEYHRIYSAKARAADPQRYREYRRQGLARLRSDVLVAYGNACACCGEREPKFLAVDHVHGGGRKHRRSIGARSAPDFYRFLKKNGFPKEDFQLLCHNCNQAKGHYGVCPHEEKRLHVAI